MTVHSRHNTAHVMPIDSVKTQVIGYNGCRLGLAAEKHVVPRACLHLHWDMTTRDGGNMAHEEWRNVVGYEGYYQVSNLGRVRSLDRTIIDTNGNKRSYPGKILKPSIKSTGYPNVTLSTNGISRTTPIHRLVAEAFLEPDETRPYVDHIDGDRANNEVENLRWCTPKENIHYAVEKGTITFDALTSAGKHTSSIRGPWCMTKIRRDDGKVYNSISEASKDLGVTKSSIYRVLNGQSKRCKGYKFETIGHIGIEDVKSLGLDRNWYQMKHQARRVIRNDGKIFSSVSEAAREIGASSGNLSGAIRKGQRCKGFRFSYVDETDESKTT